MKWFGKTQLNKSIQSQLALHPVDPETWAKLIVETGPDGGSASRWRDREPSIRPIDRLLQLHLWQTKQRHVVKIAIERCKSWSIDWFPRNCIDSRTSVDFLCKFLRMRVWDWDIKKVNVIMYLFEKFEAKMNKMASSSSPTMRPTLMVEGLT